MPQLDVSTFTGRLPRAEQARRGGVPALAPVARTPPNITSAPLERIGTALGQVAQVVDTLDARLDRAKADTLSVEAASELATRMQVRSQALVADPQIFPTDREKVFRDEFGPELQRIQDTLPLGAQAPFRRNATSMFLRLQHRLAQDGRKESLARGDAAFATTRQETLSALVSAQTETERVQILNDFRHTVQRFIVNGSLEVSVGIQALADVQSDAAVTRAELAIAQQPTRALTALQLGPENNPDIPVEKLPDLIGRAQQAVTAALVRREKQETLNERELAERQDVLASTYREQITAFDVTVPTLQTLMRQANQDRADGKLSEGDHAELGRRIPAMIDAHLTLTSPAAKAHEAELLRDFTIRLETGQDRADLDATKEEVIGQAGQLSTGSVSRLLNTYNERLNATFFSNRPSYREGLRNITGRAFPGDMTAIIMETINPQTKARYAAAIESYRNIMSQLSTDEIDAQWKEVSDTLKDQYFPLGTTEAEAAKRLPEALQNKSFAAALKIMQTLQMPLAVQAQFLEILDDLDARGLLPEDAP